MNTFQIIDNISKGNLSKARELVQSILDKKALEALETQKMNLANDLFSDKNISDEEGGEE